MNDDYIGCDLEDGAREPVIETLHGAAHAAARHLKFAFDRDFTDTLGDTGNTGITRETSK